MILKAYLVRCMRETIYQTIFIFKYVLELSSKPSVKRVLADGISYTVGRHKSVLSPPRETWRRGTFWGSTSSRGKGCPELPFFSLLCGTHCSTGDLLTLRFSNGIYGMLRK